MLNRIVAAAFAGCVALLPATEAAAQTHQMNIGHVLSDKSSYQVGMKYFADEMAKRGWTDAFATGDEFGTFLKEQDTEVAAILKQLRLA